MTTFHVPVKIGKYVPPDIRETEGVKFTPMSALAGSGAVFSMFPQSLLTEMGIEPHKEQMFIDGVKRGMGTALLGIDDAEAPCPVIFGPEGKYVLGKTALDALLLRVNADGQRLEPVEEVMAVGAPAVKDDHSATGAANDA